MLSLRKKKKPRNSSFTIKIAIAITLFLLIWFVGIVTLFDGAQKVESRGNVDVDTDVDADIALQDEKRYFDIASSHTPTTDKVTTHTYQIMYGRFLLPYYRSNPKMKMLEIGLGCNMNYGPGASIALYKELFPRAELWEAEHDGKCVGQSKAKGQLDGIHTLVGDQGDPETLDRWIIESGGDFDVIIDDGGHANCQIWTSFLKLWPTLKSGGFYFIEDMQVGRWGMYNRAHSTLCHKGLVVSDKINKMVNDLVYDREPKAEVKFIFCQSEACVLQKK